MSTTLVPSTLGEDIERVVVGGDLSRLTPEQRLSYYKSVCDSVGLNPLTKPLEYITLNGKLTLYARKDATDQLRTINQVSVTITSREVVEGCYVVTARATLPSGRTDESIGAVPIDSLKGEARCNAMMKSETKAKRRVTLSISGLGMLDETELETIPAHAKAPAEVERITEAIPLKPAPAAPASSDTETGSIILPPDDQLITVAQAQQLHKRFRECLAPSRQKHADEFLHDFLGRKLILDTNGNPSAKSIRKVDFVAIGKEAVAFAKEIPE